MIEKSRNAARAREAARKAREMTRRKNVLESTSNTRSKRAFSTFKILPRKGKIAWKFLSRPHCMVL